MTTDLTARSSAPGGTAPVRLVATDLDGTLVRRDGTVSERTVAALAACRAAGVDVVAVTGRPPRWLADLAEVVGSATAICANGAIVYDLGSGRVLRAKLLSPDVVRTAVAAVREALPGTTVALETLGGFRREPDYRPRFDVGAERTCAPLEELLADDPGVVKLLLRLEGSTADAVLDAARTALAGIAEPTHSSAGDGLVEVAALGVSKATTLAELAAERGIAREEVAAFGDMPNDLAMLRWAGHSYAVADGHPDAVAAAAGLAPPCEEDGVAQVLERLVLSR